MVGAKTIGIAATAKVICIPVATASGRAVVMSLDADASANTAPITDAPVMSPRLRERLSMPENDSREPGAASPAIGARLTSCEMLVHGSNRDRALAHRFGHAFDGAVAHVTHREHAGHAGFEGQGWSVGRARIGWQVAPREHEAMIVATDRRAEPVRARFSSDHHEQGGSRDGFMSALNILELERGEAPRSVAFDDTTS